MTSRVWTQNKNNIQELLQNNPSLLDFWSEKGYRINVEDVLSINVQAVQGSHGGIEGFVEIRSTDKSMIRYSCSDIIKGIPIIGTTFENDNLHVVIDVSKNFEAELFKTITERAADLELNTDNRSREIRS